MLDYQTAENPRGHGFQSKEVRSTTVKKYWTMRFTL